MGNCLPKDSKANKSSRDVHYTPNSALGVNFEDGNNNSGSRNDTMPVSESRQVEVRSSNNDSRQQQRTAVVAPLVNVGDKRPAPSPPVANIIAQEEIVISMYSYSGRVDQELSFEKNQRFLVLTKPNNDWWYARNLSNNEEGFIAVIYIVNENTHEAYDWYFGKLTRQEAEKLLLRDPRLVSGTFLIRESNRDHGYSLSVKRQRKDDMHITHFRVIAVENGGFYVHHSTVVPTLHDLVEYYKGNNAEAPELLTVSCPKPQPQQWDLSIETKDKWEINRNELAFLKELGHGNFGEVWHAQWNGKLDVAVKTMKEGSMTVKDFLEEANIMKNLRHPNIVILYAVCTLEQPIFIVTEYMDKGSLLHVLRTEGEHLVFPDLLEICSQVAAGMSYIEEKKLIHRDLAARNVLVDNSKMCKICDFGLARILDDEEYRVSEGKNFPVKWTAPEGITYGTYTIKSDVWSFGILMIEVITLGALPYPGMKNNEVANQVPAGYRMARPMHPVECPEELYELIKQCWKKVPEDRATFDHLSYYLSNYSVSADATYEAEQNEMRGRN